MNRTLRRFAIATWASTAVLIALFALFWRMAYAPPHAFWAITTTGAVLICGTLTTVVGLWQLVKGPGRIRAAATILLGTTPIVWLAMFVLSLYLETVSREPTTYTVPVRIIGFWSESIADIEARWRYPRWTYGQHVILLDNNDVPEPAKLVAQMDKHIEEMADRLHVQVRAAKLRWVRGSLLGMHGNALVSWAICDADQNAPDLTSLDRHEMAHAVITTSGTVDQDPPMLLCEGWAETQSKDRKDLIFELGKKTETGTIYGLQELITPEWYGRSLGPVYDHGGPLCVYLMEHYGVDKFRTLYHGVRHATFMADSERILGDSWKAVEDNFWKWLDHEYDKIKAERGIKPKIMEPEKEITFAKSVDPGDWQTIVDGYRAAWSKRPRVPEKFAFVREHSWADPPKAAGGAQERHGWLSKYVVDKDCVWHFSDYGPERFVQGEVFQPTLSACVTVMADGRINGSRKTDKHTLDDAIEEATRWSNTCDLAHDLPVGSKHIVYRTNTRIEAIHRPVVPDGKEWEIEYSSRWRDTGREVKNKLRIDAGADWSVVHKDESSSEEQTETRYSLGNVWGRQMLIEMVEQTTSKSGTSSFRLRFHELAPTEAAEVREQAESIARRHPGNHWFAWLVRPLTLAIVWPGTGILLLAAGVLLDRRRAASGA